MSWRLALGQNHVTFVHVSIPLAFMLQLALRYLHRYVHVWRIEWQNPAIL